MSDTPRTDALCSDPYKADTAQGFINLMVELSRDLERENARLREAKQGEKTVSAVEAMQKAHDALMALRTMTKAHPALHGREYIDLGIQMNNAIDGLDAAIKAAQQPVGYDTLPDSKFDAKFKHVGVSPQAQPEPMSEPVAWMWNSGDLCSVAEHAEYDEFTRTLMRPLYAQPTAMPGVECDPYDLCAGCRCTYSTLEQPEPMSDERILAILKSVDPKAVRLPTGWREFAHALLAAQPDGWVSVPKEPTDAMLNAALEWRDFMESQPRAITIEGFKLQYGSVYRAMLAAAPKEAR